MVRSTVTITFPSSTEGTFSGSVNILSNDPDRAKHTLSISVIVQPPPVPVIAVQESAIDFGTVEFAQAVQKTITITNTGTAPLEITGIESDVSGLTFEPSMFTLEPEGSQAVTVTFPSSTEGEFSGSVNILSNDPDRAKHTLSISVIVQPRPVPVLAVQEKAVDFGTVEVAQTVQQTITITNTGTAPLEITGIESDVSGLTFEPSMFTLEPNGSRTVTVTFPSSTEGTFSGLINILSNDPDRATHTLSISVIVQPQPVPAITVQETSIDFGTVEFAQPVQQTITITNTGTAPLEITGIESDVSGLTFEPSMFTLSPEGSRTVTVTLPNATEGEFSGSINISSNDPDRAKLTLSVSGIVQPPPVPVLAVQETAVDFGTVEVAQTVQQTFTVKNTGTAPLEITGIESDDVSGLTFEPSMFTLEPNGSRTVTVTFPSSTEGTFSGLINILSNDPDRATHTLSISVIVQPQPVPAITVQETSIDFGTVEFAQPVQQTITITNTGTAPLEITGIESDVSGLTFEPSMFTLSPEGSRTVTVTLPNATEGALSGSINISSNDPDRAKLTLSVSGIVQPPPVPTIAVQEKAVDFGTVEVAQTVQQTITITNTGTAPLEITGIESDVSGLTFEPSMFTLEPNGSRTVTVTFPSSTEGTFSGLINILSNDPDRATHTLSISVIVQPQPVPAITVQETSIDFGTVEFAQPVQQTITITNTGTAPLEITGIESDDVSGLTFEPSMFTLEPNGSRTVTVTFPSSTEGTFSGLINILSNDPDRATHTLSISVIVQPQPVPAITVQETSIDFGTVEFAQPVQQTITITNTGTAPLEITGIESDVSGLTFEPSVFTLSPNGSQTVTVTFPSSTAGEFSGSVNILSNDPERAKHTVSVSVIVQAAPAPVLVVGEPAIDFGSIDAEKTVQQTFTVKNTGTAPLEITGIESDLLGLTFEPSTFTLAPDGSQTVTITFPKPMEGEFSGRINILSNDPDRAMHTLSISGIVQPLSVEAKSDFNSDGTIDFTDFLLFVGAFGSTDSQYDIDGNGNVDFPDFLLFVQSFGKTLNG